MHNIFVTSIKGLGAADSLIDTVKSIDPRKRRQKDAKKIATGDDGRHWMCSAFVSEGVFGDFGLWERWSVKQAY